MHYYNEIHEPTAEWLRWLIAAGEIPAGIVDTRSILDVEPSDLAGFTQCHFFAGIGGWPLALRLAGVPPTARCWTGSPPCQPFSVAGRGRGKDDERHLAPAFLDLVAECRPPVLFGEQVRAAVTRDHWLDALLLELEEHQYTCGASVLPAAGFDAPHKRERIIFGAVADDGSVGSFRRWLSENRAFEDGWGEATVRPHEGDIASGLRAAGLLADLGSIGRQGRVPGRADKKRKTVNRSTGRGRAVGGVVNPHSELVDRCGTRREAGRAEHTDPGTARTNGSANPHYSFWAGADWILCRDGNFRPVESGTFPLADGIPARVGRLRGYGNAIVPPAVAGFIRAFISAADETVRGDI